MILEIFLFVLVIYLISNIFKTKVNLPPGPTGIPLLGTFPFDNIKKCIAAKEKYGNIFRQVSLLFFSMNLS
ncbi:hypothetical protein Avbf_18575 [Armadillidium vulgare]|nr:hypothetical protein Avbf_18575 [Armadillidium vulgare]